MKFEKNNLKLDKEHLKSNKKKFSMYIIAISFLAITLSISSFEIFDNDQITSVDVLAQTQEPVNDNITDNNNPLALSTLIEQDSPYYGNDTAPITIIDFSDFQCPMCKRHVDNTEPQINSTYMQTGEAAYVFKHLPNRGLDSKNASLAAQCTNEQGKFWEYYSLLYKNQGQIDSGWVSTENLKKFASQIKGIDMNEFNSCFDSKKYEEHVQSDLALANSLGFTETPSFIIVKDDGSNPQKIQGPKPFPVFQLAIEKVKTNSSSSSSNNSE
ncbi:DsbA family protein [Candidatus Nitrosocosmicus hydrocola]|uniref:DsbA family protein n=1 Tax=Candidatus Nitrosocosmicus hydrocola TaxID=1826872 RepID=UPI0011E5AD8B|nr:thioredoxin domain-containing protein [Candidatus Nitrosocosmicus hydrocola]